MEKTTVDIEKIMEEIREDIAKQPALDIPPFGSGASEGAAAGDNAEAPASPVMGLLKEDVQYLQNHYYHPYYSDVGGGISGFVKKVIRRLVKCIVLQLVTQLNAFNSYVADTAEVTRMAIEEQRGGVSQLKKEIAELRRRNEELSEQLKKN